MRAKCMLLDSNRVNARLETVCVSMCGFVCGACKRRQREARDGVRVTLCGFVCGGGCVHACVRAKCMLLDSNRVNARLETVCE